MLENEPYNLQLQVTYCRAKKTNSINAIRM